MLHRSLIYLFIAIFFISCGKSPIFNREETSDKIIINQISTPFFISSEDKTLEFTWIISPVIGAAAKLQIFIRNPNQELANLNSKLKFFIWMPDMGHGAPPAKIQNISVGVYEISNIYFIMEGFWQMHLEFLNNQNTKLNEIIIDYTI